MLSVKVNLDEFNRALTQYVRLSKLTVKQATVKQSSKFAFELSNRLRRLSPGKGTITAERLSALKAGGGVYVRPSVRAAVMRRVGAWSDITDRSIRMGKSGARTLRRGKKSLNLRALMVKAELGVRERGRGYLGFAARMSRIGTITLAGKQQYLDRLRREISSAGLTLAGAGASMTLEYPVRDRADIGGPMQLPRQADEVSAALNLVRGDMMEYIRRKLGETARKSGFKS